jgi:hypothetical protein
MPTDADKTFMENLTAAYELESTSFNRVGFGELKDILKENFVVKLIIPADARRDFVVELTRMNINATTMFGGLDGLARSLTQTVIWEGP